MKQFEQSIQVIRNACLPKSGADQGTAKLNQAKLTWRLEGFNDF